MHPLMSPAETIVERVAGAADGADRIDDIPRASWPCADVRRARRRCARRYRSSEPQTPSSNCSRENTRPGRSIKNSSSLYSVGPRSIRLSAARHPFLLTVEFDVADRQHFRRPLRVARRNSALTRADELRHRERLDDVVIGAGREPAHLLALLAARGEHDNRQLPRFRPRTQPTAELDAGEARQHPVEHDADRARSPCTRVSASSPRAALSTS